MADKNKNPNLSNDKESNKVQVAWRVWVLIFSFNLCVRLAIAAEGDLLQTVNIPPVAQGFGTSVAIVPGSMIGLNQYPILLVTSRYGEGTLYFLNPATNPASVIKTINTNPIPPGGWGSLSLRGDNGDLLGCGNGGIHGIYAIDIDPSNATPDGTAIFLFNSAPGFDICDGVTWDSSDNTIFQSPDVSSTIFHFDEVGTLQNNFSSPAGCPNSGLAVGGDSLFAACNGILIIHQMEKSNGEVLNSFPSAGTRTEDLECDPVSFSAMTKDAMWSKDAHSDQVFAFEIPSGTCGFAGNPSFVPPSLLETPQQPVYDDFCPPQNSTAKNLVLTTHGWLSNKNVWATPMVQAIQNQIGSNPDWDICAYDWEKDANTGLTDPWAAFDNAQLHGEKLGVLLSARNYNHIHFISHSAGSNLVQTATEILRRIKGEDPSVLTIHSTFLDAFEPTAEQFSIYGRKANWAEQYVDTRALLPIFGNVDDTDAILRQAYNFDVTGLDSAQNQGNDETTDEYAVRVHSWPIEWYMTTILLSQTFPDLGFNLSIESGQPKLPSHSFVTTDQSFFERGGVCDLSNNMIQDLSDCPSTRRLSDFVNLALNDPIDFSTLAANQIASSDTGTINFSTTNSIIMSTGSPVWVSMQFDVATPINILQFNYEFKSDAEGLLSVFFDNQLVLRADERLKSDGRHKTDTVWVGNVNSGQHTLSFRLDPFNNVQSVIEVSNVQTGIMEVISTIPVTIGRNQSSAHVTH